MTGYPTGETVTNFRRHAHQSYSRVRKEKTDSGYAGIALFTFAICGLFGQYLRALRVMLAAWGLVAIGASSGVVFFNQLLLAIPGVNYTAYSRYLDGSWELALALLAAFFVYDVSKAAARLWMLYVAATTVALLAIGLGISGGQTFVRDALAQPGYATWCWASVIFAAIVIIFMWATTIQALTVRKRLLIVAGTVIIEASLNYLIPTLGYPRSVVLSESPVAFLHSHLGLQRFYSFGPLFPNSGSYFGIAELDDLELPVAKSWSNYTAKHLDRLAGQGALLGQHFDQLAENIASYERVATKYVLIRRSNLPDFEAAFRTGTEHPLLAYSDDFLMIYQLPHPSSYFSAPGCVLLADSRERVTAQ